MEPRFCLTRNGDPLISAMFAAQGIAAQVALEEPLEESQFYGFEVTPREPDNQYAIRITWARGHGHTAFHWTSAGAICFLGRCSAFRQRVWESIRVTLESTNGRHRLAATLAPNCIHQPHKTK
jgi:hypothetical protein